MLLTVHSDLHLCHSDVDIPNKSNVDTLILSGDILLADCLKDYPRDYPDKFIDSYRHIQAIRFRNFLKYCSEDFKNVIYVAGNHEGYHYYWYDTLRILKDECDEFPNIHFLENKSVIIDDVIFIGATLWTDCNNYDPLTMMVLKDSMNDYKLIKNERDGYRKASPSDTIMRHKESLKYINSAVANAPLDKKIVVVTHHAPSFLSIADQYKNDREMNGGYVTDLSDFILDNPRIKKWFHGHTHSFFNYMIGSTEIICNPRGYVNERYAEETGWKQDLVIEI